MLTKLKGATVLYRDGDGNIASVTTDVSDISIEYVTPFCVRYVARAKLPISRRKVPVSAYSIIRGGLVIRMPQLPTVWATEDDLAYSEALYTSVSVLESFSPSPVDKIVALATLALCALLCAIMASLR